MIKDDIFTMKLEPELRKAFMTEAEAVRQPATQIVSDLMREFIRRQRDAREYNAFLGHKVAAARASMRSGKGRSNDRVESKFAKRRQLAKGRA